MPFKQGTIEPDWIVVHYDISAKKPAARAYLLRKLREYSAAPRTESVYLAEYNSKLEDDIRKFAEANEYDVTVIVETPAYEESQNRRVRQIYEESFQAQFDQLERNLIRARDALSGDLLYTDKYRKKRPYNHDQIEQMLKSAGYFKMQLERALAKRKEISTKFKADKFEIRLQAFGDMVSKFYDANEKRVARKQKQEKKEQEAGKDETPATS